MIFNATPNSKPPRSRNFPDKSVNLPDGLREDCARSVHVRECLKMAGLFNFYLMLKASKSDVIFTKVVFHSSFKVR